MHKGNQLNTNAYDENPFRYCGEYYDEETGSVYLRTRYYNTGTGRFLTEDPIRSGYNWYSYCSNNPIAFIDPSGFDAIIIANSDAAYGFGHTSAIYQDKDGEWYYTYWGDKAAAVIHIPNEYVVSSNTVEREGGTSITTTFSDSSMESLSNFNESLNKFLSDYGYSNITSDYTSAVYIEGDFTTALDAAYSDVNNAFSNENSVGYYYVHNDGSAVFQGKNGAYNLFANNCLQRTVSSFGKGILDNGSSVSKYLKDQNYSNFIIPNIAQVEFINIFGNSSFNSLNQYNYSVEQYRKSRPYSQILFGI